MFLFFLTFLKKLKQVVSPVTQSGKLKLSFFYGCLLACGQAPLSLTWLICFGPLLGIWTLQQQATPRLAFWQGWWFSLGYFMVCLYWIGFAFTIDLQRFAWMIPFAVVGLPVVLAFLTAPGFWLTARLAPSLHEAGRILLFASLWTALEMTRGWIFTGFPWATVGYIWITDLPIAQSLAYVGIYGLSFLTILLGLSFSVRNNLFIQGIQLVCMLFFCGCAFRYYTRSERDFVPNLTLRLVQPSIPQQIKWSPAHREENFNTLLELTFSSPLSTKEGQQIYIWPESATSFFLGNDTKRCAQILDRLPLGSVLMTGTPRGEYKANLRKDGPLESPREPQIWNSLLVLETKSKLKTFYDKSHLVPFGEYIPLRNLLSGIIEKVTPGSIDYSAGMGPRTLEIADLPPFAPAICYEIIFPGAIIAKTNPRPAWILNITNDAWYGHTSGPYQHFAIARARAIEEGLPVVRVGNNGISGVIDPHGHVLQKLTLDERGVLDVLLPRALSLTPYARWGNMIIMMILSMTFISLLFCRQTHCRDSSFPEKG